MTIESTDYGKYTQIKNEHNLLSGIYIVTNCIHCCYFVNLINKEINISISDSDFQLYL